MQSVKQPSVGDTYEFLVWIDRKQHRVVGQVTRVIYWMDNSVEVVGVALDDGREIRSMTVYPHGDACF